MSVNSAQLYAIGAIIFWAVYLVICGYTAHLYCDRVGIDWMEETNGIWAILWPVGLPIALIILGCKRISNKRRQQCQIV